MRISEISQKASKLLEVGMKEGTPDPFLSQIALEAKETALSLMGEERGKEAVIKAFLELILAAHIMDVDLETEISELFRKKIAKELAEAG